jgi:uncharacterized protein (TIGR03083 family)
MILRSREAEALLETVHQVDPASISRCDGWTTHEIVAHVAGIALEVNRHLDPYLQDEPVPETRSFEEREAPLQAMHHDDLLSRLESEESQMRNLVAAVLERDPDSSIRWTGRQMTVAKFIPHLRNEHALHRWDLVGNSEEGSPLVGQPDLVRHSVEVLGRILLVAGRRHDPASDDDFSVRLCVKGEPDLSVVVENGQAGLVWTDDCEGPTVEMDDASRHLFIWGRKPEGPERLFSYLSQTQLTRLQALLSGY